MFSAAWKAPVKKFAEYWFSSPSHPQGIIARNGNLAEQSRPLLRGRRWKVRVRGGQAAAAFPGWLVCVLGDGVDCSASFKLRLEALARPGPPEPHDQRRREKQIVLC